MKKSLDVGVQSFCFRNFRDNAVVAAKVRGIGLEKIELCAAHADFDDPRSFAEVAALYRDAGVSIVSLGVQILQGNDAEKAWFECAAVAGARHLSVHLRVDSFQKAIPKAQAWSREFGIQVGIHCHGGYMFGGQPDVLRHLLDLGGPEIGLCLDTAWCLQVGPVHGDPVAWAREFAGRITGVHYKDFVFERNGQWKDVIIGTGNLDLPGFVQALEDGGFSGMAVIEYEGEADHPDESLRRCVAALRGELGSCQ